MVDKIECLNEKYSTTRLCYKLLDDKYLDENGKIKEEYKFKLNFPEFGIVDSKISAKEGEKFDTYLFLPEGEGRKGEGGLRTRGYFKFSYSYDENLGFRIEGLDIPIKIAQPSTLNSQSYPLITIITVVYNGEKHLEETIQSVINQTYPNVEYIIIDGGSTDGTLDIIKKYEDKIDYWVSEKDKGIYDAMNKGIDLASGEWINFMNAGDKFYDEKVLEKVFLNNDFSKDVGVIYGNHKVIYTNKNSLLKYIKAPNKLNKNNLIYKWSLLSHQAIFYKTSLHKKLKFNLCNSIGADFEVTYKILNNYKSLYKDIIIDIESAGGISDIKRIDSIINWWNCVEKKNSQNLFFIYLVLKEMIKSYIKNIIGYNK